MHLDLKSSKQRGAGWDGVSGGRGREELLGGRGGVGWGGSGDGGFYSPIKSAKRRLVLTDNLKGVHVIKGGQIPFTHLSLPPPPPPPTNTHTPPLRETLY